MFGVQEIMMSFGNWRNRRDGGEECVESRNGTRLVFNFHNPKQEITMSLDSDFPNYSYADEMRTPREIGITRDGSFDGIARAVAGVNYYADTIGFGTSTQFAKDAGMTQTPLGVRFFTKTGMKCSNGADMYDYVDTITKGTLVGKRVNDELKLMGLPQLRGLAPGIMEDAASAMDPRPIFGAVAGSGYPKCKKVTLPVGDGNGRLQSAFDPSNVWIKGATTSVMLNGKATPHQTRWVFDSWIPQEEYAATEKTEAAKAEGFMDAATTYMKPAHVAAIGMLAVGLVGLCISSKVRGGGVRL